LKRAAGQDDQSQIAFRDFMSIVDKFKGKLTEEEQDSLLITFPG